MSEKHTLSRRDLLRLTAGAATTGLIAACQPAAPQVVEVEKQVPVEKVVKETVIVEKEVVVEKPAKPAEAVELDIMWRTNPGENPFLEDLIVAFEKKNPGISVEQIVVPWDEFEPKLMSTYAAGIAPDVIGMGGTNPYVERALRGMVLDLEPYLDQYPDFTESLWPVAIDSYTIQGKIVGIPYAVLSAGVFINATRFDEAGVEYPPLDWKDDSWTWEVMIETAKKLTLDKNGDGKLDQYGIQLSHSSPWQYTRLWGKDLISDEDYAAGIIRKWQTDDPNVYNALVDGLQARADAIYRHEVTPSPETAESLQQMGSPLKTGAVAMDFTGGWAVEGALPEEFKFRCVVNPLGGVQGSGTRGGHTWANPLQIIESTANPDAAWEFIKFFISDPDTLPVKHKHNQRVPSVRAFFDDYIVEYSQNLAMTEQEARTFYGGAIEQAETSVPCHVLAGWAAVRDIFNAELDPVWLGDKSAKEAVDTMIPLVNDALQQYLEESGLG